MFQTAHVLPPGSHPLSPEVVGGMWVIRGCRAKRPGSQENHSLSTPPCLSTKVSPGVPGPPYVYRVGSLQGLGWALWSKAEGLPSSV